MSVYDRQRTLPLTIPERVTVIGCGGVGFWVALYLGMAGVKRIEVFDQDVIQEHNLNRLPVPQSAIGRPKVEVLREMLVSLRPDAVVLAYPLSVNDAILAGLQPEVVIDATDDMRVQLSTYKFCLKNNIRYIRVGYNGGAHLTICSTVPEWDLDPLTDTHYEVVPSWIVPAAMAAALGLVKLMLDPTLDFSGGIDLRRDNGGIDNKPGDQNQNKKEANG